MFCEQSMEIFNGVAKAMYTNVSVEGCALRASTWATFENESLAKILAPIESAIVKSGGPFILGSKVSAADVCLFGKKLQKLFLIEPI